MATRFEGLTPDWLGLDEALDAVLAGVAPLPAEEVPVHEGAGRVLASDLRARVTLPPFDNSAMDGYAVRADDVRGASDEAPVELRVVGAIHAGDAPRPAVDRGQAVRIMTGAPLPPGADMVVRVEDTDGQRGHTDRVRIHSDRDLGRHIRPGGQDFGEGDRLLERGRALNPGALALAVAGGHGRLDVVRRPRVAVLTCGDELRAAGDVADVLKGRAVPDSNAPMLAAALSEAGAVPVVLAPATDDPAVIRARVAEAVREGVDALVTVGGASMGEADLLKRTLLEDGLELAFWRVRIRPGSPFGFGHLPCSGGSLPVFGLPGNPASAFVTFELFVRPWVRARAGHAAPHRPVVLARPGEDLRSTGRLCHLLRVRWDAAAGDTPEVWLAGPQGSGLVGGLAQARGLAVVPEDVEVVEAGAAVEVIDLGGSLAHRPERAFRVRRGP